MKSRNNVAILVLCSLILGFSSACSEKKGRESQGKERPFERPNILWISLEDLSPRLGCYGDTLAESPAIDRLAEEGIRYTNVFTSAPVCAPCRSGIITGMNQTSIGTHHMRVTHSADGLPTPYEAVPPHYVKTFTEYLRAAGYYCTNNSKTDYQFDSPLTAWDENGREATYRNRADKSRPFFSVFNLTTTHESQNWKKPVYTDPEKVTVPPYYPDTRIVRENIASLYDNIRTVDRQVERILAELEESGEAANTIVFFWTDHGDGLPRAKRWLYDSGLRVPLIVRYPDGRYAGSTDDRLISSVDFGPAVLSLAGVEVPAHMQGQAFVGRFASGTGREFVFSARDRFDESYDMVRSIRTSQYRYIRNYYPQLPYIIWVPYRNRMPVMQELIRLDLKDSLDPVQELWMAANRPVEELYDCISDPHNVVNLASEPKYSEVLSGMRNTLDDYMARIGDMGAIPEDQMAEVFWPGGVQPETYVPRFLFDSPDGPEQQLDGQAIGLSAPCRVKLQCPTHGASIAYTFEEGENVHWELYSGPVNLKQGHWIMRARAIRIGYRESSEVRCEITVE